MIVSVQTSKLFVHTSNILILARETQLTVLIVYGLKQMLIQNDLLNFHSHVRYFYFSLLVHVYVTGLSRLYVC